VTCTASDGCHVAGTCNPSNGLCSNPAASDGTSCDDGDATTCGDTCSAGVCSGTPVPEPPEIGSDVAIVRSAGSGTLSWTDLPGPYHVYRGAIDLSTPWAYTHACLVPDDTETHAAIDQDPPPGTLFYYLVSRVNQCRESVIGRDGSGAPIPNASACGGGQP
jgi:hypothetical protein